MNVFRGKDQEDRGLNRLGERARLTIDRVTKIPKRVTEIDMYPSVVQEGEITISEENVDHTLRGFIREHRDVLQVDADELELISARKINKRWYVKYQQQYRGLPVHEATVGLDATEDGKVGTYAASYLPDIDLPTEPRVSLDQATETAIETYPKRQQRKLHRKDDVLLVYPVRSEDEVEHHLAWKLQIVPDETDPEAEKYFVIDALDGTILRSYSARFPGAQVIGTVQGEVYPANPTDPVSTVPIRNE